MSYISDYRCGALSYEDYRRERNRENMEDIYYWDHQFDDVQDEEDEYDEES